MKRGTGSAGPLLVDMQVVILRTSDRAVLVEPLTTARAAAWVPLSLVELSPNEDGKSHQMTIPEWLANDKALL